MIVVTGAAGFIGSALLGRLQADGYGDLVAVDDFTLAEKSANLAGKNIGHCVEREHFFEWAGNHADRIQCVLHIGARTDTSEFNEEILNHLNPEYSKRMWNFCCANDIPLIYASSAATYGDGSQGFDVNTDNLELLKPLNPYGWSKHQFDLWVMEQSHTPPFWAGFKFFNVYGPNEYHKGRMASVVFHAFNQINASGKLKLFRSHRPDFNDGEQKRDFIYVRDVLDVLVYFMENRKNSGLYNLGSGTARTFADLGKAVFTALNKDVQIEFIDIPADIRDKYQYFTEANMNKLRAAGYTHPFTSLEEGVSDYVNKYLSQGDYC